MEKKLSCNFLALCYIHVHVHACILCFPGLSPAHEAHSSGLHPRVEGGDDGLEVAGNEVARNLGQL